MVAIEILRAPYSKEVYEFKGEARFRWPTCLLYRAELTAATAEGLTPNAFRPQEFQVWNKNLLASDFVVDWGDRTEKLRPIEIVGVRNGAFSGKVMVGSSKPIQGLKRRLPISRGRRRHPGRAGANSLCPALGRQLQPSIPQFHGVCG